VFRGINITRRKGVRGGLKRRKKKVLEKKIIKEKNQKIPGQRTRGRDSGNKGRQSVGVWIHGTVTGDGVGECTVGIREVGKG